MKITYKLLLVYSVVASVVLCVTVCKHSSPVSLDATSIESLDASINAMRHEVGVNREGLILRAYQLIIDDSYEKAGVYNKGKDAMNEYDLFSVYAPRLNGRTADELIDEMKNIDEDRKLKRNESTVHQQVAE